MRHDIDIEKYIPFAEKACEFLSNSPDPYHCVQNNVDKLIANGYVALSKKKPFAGILEPGGKYFYTVNKTTLVTFAVGHKYRAGNGFKIIGGKCCIFVNVFINEKPQIEMDSFTHLHL